MCPSFSPFYGFLSHLLLAPALSIDLPFSPTTSNLYAYSSSVHREDQIPPISGKINAFYLILVALLAYNPCLFLYLDVHISSNKKVNDTSSLFSFMLGMEPEALYILGKHSTTELQPHSFFNVFPTGFYLHFFINLTTEVSYCL